jgi:predicted permease
MILPVLETRHAARRLARAPVFSLTTLLVLTLGIGSSVALFSIVNGVILRPLPYADPGQLVSLSHSIVVPGIDHVDQSDATFLLYQRHNQVFSGIGSYRESEANLAPTTGSGGDAERVSTASVSASLLPMLGVAPLIGRSFVAGEDRSDAARVIILSEALWQKRFGGDRSILGKTVLDDGVPTQVVGIMPSSFQFPTAHTEAWVPTRFDAAHTSPGSFNYEAVARLRPGVTLQAAKADLDRVLPRLLDEYPSDIPPAMFASVHLQSIVRPLRDVIVADVSSLLWILFGTGVVVLLISCANVANLFLIRGEARHRELAVRTALGAGRSAVLVQYFSEAALLAGAGGLAGLAIADVAIRLLGKLPAGLSLPRMAEVSLDGRVILFAVAVTLVTAIAVSLVPLLRARRVPLSAVLKDSGRSATSGVERQHSRNALVVAQIALALVLVTASGLMLRSFARLRDVSPGFDAEHALTMRFALPDAKYGSALSRMQYFNELADRVRAIPGVAAVGFTDWLPLSGDNNNTVMAVEDHPIAKNEVPAVHDMAEVSGEYFRAMGIPLVSGRTFGAQDAAHPVAEAVVSHAFAKRYWKAVSPLGKRIRPGIDGPWYTIIGEVGDVHFASLDKPAEDVVYFPQVMAGHDSGSDVDGAVALVVRSTRDPAALTPAIRQAVHTLDPSLPTYQEQTMARVLANASARTQFTMWLLAVAGIIALTLGAVGIYGVMAYGVSLRHREIGVRMALGARPSDVAQMISRQGVTLAGVGIVVGIAVAIVVTRFMRGLLYDVSATDPMTLSGTCVLLLLVALVASWLPARRAAGVDPAEALRSD